MPSTARSAGRFIGRAASVGPTGARSGRGRRFGFRPRRIQVGTSYARKARRLTRRLLSLARFCSSPGCCADAMVADAVTWLWLKTILVSLAAMAWSPPAWDQWLFRLREGSSCFRWRCLRCSSALRLRSAGGGRRALTARSLSVPHAYGPGWFRSLVWP